MMKALNIVRKHDPSGLVQEVDDALTAAVLKTDIDTSVGIYSIKGMSGKKYRYFINQLVRNNANPRYLEVGSWAGSTLCSAIHGNKVKAVAIDNWSEFGGPKETFMQNVQYFSSPDAKVFFYESDFRAVDYGKIGETFNIYLFDGPHEAKDQYDGLDLALTCLEDQFVFIVDDWNWDRVREGTFAAIEKCGLNVLYAAEIRSTLDGDSPPHLLPLTSWEEVKNFDWHNGYFISVLEKPSARR
jgi:hypothetical protein